FLQSVLLPDIMAVMVTTFLFFFFPSPSPTDIYTLSLHDALPICKSYQSSFTAETDLVQKHCFVSNYTKTKIVVKSIEVQSVKDIAKDCRVPSHTVQSEINKAAQSFKPSL